jgi:hypothetical protein
LPRNYTRRICLSCLINTNLTLYWYIWTCPKIHRNMNNVLPVGSNYCKHWKKGTFIKSLFVAFALSVQTSLQPCHAITTRHFLYSVKETHFILQYFPLQCVLFKRLLHFCSHIFAVISDFCHILDTENDNSLLVVGYYR